MLPRLEPAPPSALVVEDDEMLRTLYVTAFRLRGFVVDEAEFAEVAIDRLLEQIDAEEGPSVRRTGG